MIERLRRVLYLAYYFPPIGGAGVRRNAKFVRYLPELGYELSVVTGPGSPDYRWTPIDDAFETGAPGAITVYRVRGPEPRRSDGVRGKAERWLRMRSPWEGWWMKEALAIAQSVGRVDLIHASLNPYLTAPAAATIARELGKPLVVDLEDPWAFDEMMVYPTSLHRRLDLAAMRRALDAADAVVMNTPEAARRVRERFPHLGRKPVTAIPNGFDSADFRGDPPQRRDGVFRVVHTGSLHTDLGLRHRQMALVRRLLGGAAPGVDLLTRSHVFLLEAIDALLGERSDLAGRIEVHLAGALTEEDRAAAARYPFVRELGFLPHRETVAVMRSADLLFLPLHDLPAGRRLSIVPCKTYEYLASGRPILAAIPDGDARDLLVRAGGVFLCRPTDIGAMSRIIAERLRRKDAGIAEEPRDTAVLTRFDPRTTTQALADVFAQLPAVATAVTVPTRVADGLA